MLYRPRVMAHRFTIVGIGEAVYDLFPDTQRLGGAPLNVARQADHLARLRGGRGVIVSRIGQDGLGDDMLGELRAADLETGYLQSDPDRPTGQVIVELDEDGDPDYEIVRNVAWDVMQYDPELDQLAANCSGVTFGSLAQRDGQSRNTIYRFLDACRRATRLFDVNLREDFFDRRILARSLELAHLAKMNLDELRVVLATLGLPVPNHLGVDADDFSDDAEAEAARRLRLEFDVEGVIITRGARGTAAHTAEGVVTAEVPRYEAAPGADPVGAGDAATAAFLVARSLRWPTERAVLLANHMGAWAASQPGAVPELPEAIAGLMA